MPAGKQPQRSRFRNTWAEALWPEQGAVPMQQDHASIDLPTVLSMPSFPGGRKKLPFVPLIPKLNGVNQNEPR